MGVVRILAAVLIVTAFAGCVANWEPKLERLAAPDDNQPANEAGAVGANIFYVPGRALLCGTSAVLAFGVMAITFGQEHTTATELMHGGCSGPWTLEPKDVR